MGISWDDVAKACNTSPAQLWQWLNKGQDLRTSSIERLAKALHIQPGYLAFGEGESAIQQLSPEDRLKEAVQLAHDFTLYPNNPEYRAAVNAAEALKNLWHILYGVQPAQNLSVQGSSAGPNISGGVAPVSHGKAQSVAHTPHRRKH